MDDINSKPQENNESAAENSIPPNIYLIMEGVKAIPLDVVRVTIGRSHDNMVVVDDPRVSRHHTEIRFLHGNFVIFDLNSSGGTFLNGRRTNQGILYPGDLISLAGVNFVFTRDTRLTGYETDLLEPEGPGKRDTVSFDKNIRKDNLK